MVTDGNPLTVVSTVPCIEFSARSVIRWKLIQHCLSTILQLNIYIYIDDTKELMFCGLYLLISS